MSIDAEDILERTKLVVQAFRGCNQDECIRIYVAALAALGLNRSNPLFQTLSQRKKESETDPSQH